MRYAGLQQYTGNQETPTHDAALSEDSNVQKS